MSQALTSFLQPGEVVIHRANGSAAGTNPLAGLEIWVTRRRILVSTGWLQRKVETRMVSDIASIDLAQTMFDRLLGIGTIRIQFGRPNLPPMELKDIGAAHQLFAVLLQLQARR